MKYIVYITTNQVNGKIYIGIHRTENPEVFDNYIGCGVFTNSPKSYMNGGTLFQRAVQKYGPSKFKRKTIRVFETLEEAKDLEAQLVDEQFVQRTDTYNMTVGGGVPPDLSKKIYQFDLQGNLIKEWENQIEVTNYYKCYKDAIYESIKHKRSFKDCYWGHSKDIDVSEYRLNKTNRFVYQYNLQGNLLNTFESIQEASNKLDIDRNRIVNAISGKNSVDDCYFLPADVNVFEVIEWRKSKNSGRKIVYRYTLDGKYDAEFKSLIEAAKAVGLKSKSSISAAIKDPTKTSGGYRWSLHKSENIPEYVKQDPKKAVAVNVFTKEGELFKTFNTVSECMKEFPYCRRVLRGERKSAHGYIFKYIS